MSKEHRAQLARENGAKSIGAPTAAGLEKCQSANRKPGMCTRLNTWTREAYAALRAEVRDFFQPGSVYEERRVERLVRYHWELRRLDGNISKPSTKLAVTPPPALTPSPTSTAKSAPSTGKSIAGNEREFSRRCQSPPADQPKCR